MDHPISYVAEKMNEVQENVDEMNDTLQENSSDADGIAKEYKVESIEKVDDMVYIKEDLAQQIDKVSIAKGNLDEMCDHVKEDIAEQIYKVKKTLDDKEDTLKENESEMDEKIHGLEPKLSKEHENVLEKVNELTTFLESVKHYNDESIMRNISDPLDVVLSSLKCVPIGAKCWFSILPAEVTDKILGYLTGDSEVILAAAVCKHWMNLLNKRLGELEKVEIVRHQGQRCWCEEGIRFKDFNEPRCWCQESITFMPQVLIASTVLNLNIPVTLDLNPTFSPSQIRAFFEAIENIDYRIEILNVDSLPSMFQDRLQNCLLQANNLSFDYVSPRLEGSLVVAMDPLSEQNHRVLMNKT